MLFVVRWNGVCVPVVAWKLLAPRDQRLCSTAPAGEAALAARDAACEHGSVAALLRCCVAVLVCVCVCVCQGPPPC